MSGLNCEAGKVSKYELLALAAVGGTGQPPGATSEREVSKRWQGSRHGQAHLQKMESYTERGVGPGAEEGGGESEISGLTLTQ